MQIFFAHLKLQLRRLLRNPAFWVPTVLFPMMLYSFFGAALPPAGIYSQMAIASFTIYAVVGVAFYQFGIGIALDREDPFFVWVKTLPLNSIPNGLAQIVSALILALTAVMLVLIASYLFGKTQLTLEQSLRLILVCLIVSIPAALMGIALGYSARERAASALANLIFLPLAFLGGLWIAPAQLPNFAAKISDYTPTRQMGEFAWSAILGTMPEEKYIFGIIAYTIFFAILTFILIKIDGKKRFG